LIVLVAAEKLAEADRWVQRLIRREPENTDLLRRRARILNGLKRYAEALKIGEQSRKSSGGRIEFLVIEQMANSYIGLGKVDAAKKVLDEALTRPELALEKMKEQFDKLTSLRKMLDANEVN
jgi:predicted Zn-dependent protease